jgi:hypothetical protein
MGRFAREPTGGEIEQAPAGTHLGICFRVIDLGTQHSEWEGEAKISNQVLISWELPGETMEDGRPFAASRFYTNSLHEKAALRKDLASWRGRDFTEVELAGFDLGTIVGKPCLLSIVHNKKGKAKVAAVLAVPKGTTAPTLVNDTLAFFLDDWDEDAWEKLPKGIKAIIQKSDEYHAMKNGDAPDDDAQPAAVDEEEIPVEKEEIPF